MTGSRDAQPGDARWYEIRLGGLLDPRWAAWFDGLDLTTEPAGTTRLRGPLADQSALHGVLQRVRDVGLPLISVTRVDPEHQAATQPAVADPSETIPHPTGQPHRP